MNVGRESEHGPCVRGSDLGFLTCWGLLLVCAVSIAACRRATPTAIPLPSPTIAISHRDALPLMLSAEDLGRGYEAVEAHRLEPGRGWGDDTTRLSGYRMVFVGGRGVFSRITCQVECYLSVKDAQDAYRAYREDLAADLKGNASYGSVGDSEERLLGDWNRMYTIRAQDLLTVHYVFLRENVFVELALSGPDVPEFPDQAARQARLLDERIFQQ